MDGIHGFLSNPENIKNQHAKNLLRNNPNHRFHPETLRHRPNLRPRRRNPQNLLRITPQHFRHGQCRSNRPARRMRRIPITQFTQLPKPVARHIFQARLQPSADLRYRIAVPPKRPHIRNRQRPQQPRINRSLMLRPIARHRIPAIMPHIRCLAPRKASHAHRR
jgi:hypothetical protein